MEMMSAALPPSRDHALPPRSGDSPARRAHQAAGGVSRLAAMQVSNLMLMMVRFLGLLPGMLASFSFHICHSLSAKTSSQESTNLVEDEVIFSGLSGNLCGFKVDLRVPLFVAPATRKLTFSVFVTVTTALVEFLS